MKEDILEDFLKPVLSWQTSPGKTIDFKQALAGIFCGGVGHDFCFSLVEKSLKQ
jgi:hypothetical protein